MYNGKIKAGRKLLDDHGFSIPDDLLAELVAVMQDQPAAVYEPGDFVAYNEGMGEQGYGTVEVLKPNGFYRIACFRADYSTHVPSGDMSEVITVEEALRRIAFRNGDA